MLNKDKHFIYFIDKDVRIAYHERLTAHIAYVKEAGVKLGIPYTHLEKHDDSKWLPCEFTPYANWFCGVKSKENEGEFWKAWHHHMRSNPHHWQYWCFPYAENLNKEGVSMGAIAMPELYATEMVADWMGASMAYSGRWDITEWLSEKSASIFIHPQTAHHVRGVLRDAGYSESFLYHLDFVTEKGGDVKD